MAIVPAFEGSFLVRDEDGEYFEIDPSVSIIPNYDYDSPNTSGDMFPSYKDECARRNDKAKREPEYITIEAGFLEHLLNCLANQKYMEMHDDSNPPSDTQRTINLAWEKGMEILNNKKSNMKGFKNE